MLFSVQILREGVYFSHNLQMHEKRMTLGRWGERVF